MGVAGISNARLLLCLKPPQAIKQTQPIAGYWQGLQSRMHQAPNYACITVARRMPERIRAISGNSVCLPRLTALLAVCQQYPAWFAGLEPITIEKKGPSNRFSCEEWFMAR